MKFTKIFLAVLCGSLMFSCEWDSFEDESGLTNLENANSFVRLLTGNAAGTETVEVSQANTSTDVSIESRQTTGGEVTANYTLGGTAEYGTIYNIDGATASGGSIAIPFQTDESTAPASGDVTINFLVDTLVAGSQTIILTLESASSDDGTTLDVGQGTLRKELILTLVND